MRATRTNDRHRVAVRLLWATDLPYGHNVGLEVGWETPPRVSR